MKVKIKKLIYHTNGWVRVKKNIIWLTEIYQERTQRDYIRILAITSEYVKVRLIHVAKKQTKSEIAKEW